MLLRVDKHSGVPIFRQIVDGLRSQIAGQLLTVGDPLPSVKDLAGQLKVNPMTVSKAYMLLDMEGLLHRRRGIGLFVKALPKTEQAHLREKILRQAVQKLVQETQHLGFSRKELSQVLNACWKEEKE